MKQRWYQGWFDSSDIASWAMLLLAPATVVVFLVAVYGAVAR